VTNIQAYQQSFLSLRKGSGLDFPIHVHIETQAICNAACNFCPYPRLERKGEVMPTSMFEKIVDDLTAIPRLHKFQLSLFKVNEPLMEPRLYQFLELIREKLPNALPTITTNASLLTDEHIQNLSKQGLAYLWISFNDHRKDEYQKTMKLPFIRTVENLKNLHSIKKNGMFASRVVLSRVGDGTPDDQGFVKWVNAEFPLFEAGVFQRGDWMGQVDNKSSQSHLDCGCKRWFELSITATGTVALCCMDGQAEHPIGDVSINSVLEIYNSQNYKKLRIDLDSRQGIEFCKSCSFL
jgi:radical SAM protein with 4Fe4S-binding SPASM domain|tara:strand:- start:486 stop:1367 length:882 start_codon:yes stop_codon:yes gene_type:complete